MTVVDIYVNDFVITKYVDELDFSIKAESEWGGVDKDNRMYASAKINSFDPFINKLIELSSKYYLEKPEYQVFTKEKYSFIGNTLSLYIEKAYTSCHQLNVQYEKNYKSYHHQLLSIMMPLIKEYILKTYTKHGHKYFLNEIIDNEEHYEFYWEYYKFLFKRFPKLLN